MSYWVRPLIRFYFRGDRFTDPIDKKTFRKFLPYGYVRQRPNALSPSTFSLERHRFLWLYLQRKTDFFTKPLKVLHIAPEQCFYKRFRGQGNLDYTTLDISSPLADVKADICSLPFEENTYDVIFCNHVLEHIIDDGKAIRELYRVLKIGGWAVLQVPQDLQRDCTYEDFTITSSKERTRHFGQYDHVRLYGRDYCTRLEKEGFAVFSITCKELVTPEEIKTYALNADEILPLGFKT